MPYIILARVNLTHLATTTSVLTICLEFSRENEFSVRLRKQTIYEYVLRQAAAYAIRVEGNAQADRKKLDWLTKVVMIYTSC
jgi:hypothetical protein